MTRYFTDEDGTVYELLGVEVQRNAGLMGGTTSSYIMRTGVDEPSIRLTLEQFKQLTPVDSGADQAVAKLYADLDAWDRGEVPEWLR